MLNDYGSLVFFHLINSFKGIAIGVALGAAFAITFSLVFDAALGITTFIAFSFTVPIAAGILMGMGLYDFPRINVAVIAGLLAGGSLGTPLSIISGLAGSKAAGTVGASTLGVAFGIIGFFAGWSAGSVVVGIFGGAAGLIGGVVLGSISFSVSNVISVGIFLGLVLGIACSTVGEAAFGFSFGISYCLGFEIAALRLYYYPIHRFFFWPSIRSHWYSYHPVAWDDLCPFPFPNLDLILSEYAKELPDEGKKEIERLIAHYPSQRTLALKAKVSFLSHQASRIDDLVLLSDLAHRLPSGRGEFLMQTAEVGRMLEKIASLQVTINTVDRPILRYVFAELIVKEIEQFRHRIGGFDQSIASEFYRASKRWLSLAHVQLESNEVSHLNIKTPQVFRAGDPVDRSQEAFVIRDTVVSQIENQLMLSTGCPGLHLYGRRRIGKTTILVNLSEFVPPNIKIVFVSMQRPRFFTSFPSFVLHLHGKLSTIFRSLFDLKVTPPDLQYLFQLLTRCNELAANEGLRLLLAIDEYETIDLKIGQGIFPLDLLNAIRESTQFHRNITWIFSGSHDMTELPHAPWTSYLVSTRTVEIPMFTLEETHLLLTEPMKFSPLWAANDSNQPRFSSGFWGHEGIERIHHEAGGWPHMVQLVAETLIDLVNERGAKKVTPTLLEDALDSSVIRGGIALYEIMHRESSLPGEWEYLSTFRHTTAQQPPSDEAVRTSLQRRLLIETEGEMWRLRIPLTARWLRQRG